MLSFTDRSFLLAIILYLLSSLVHLGIGTTIGEGLTQLIIGPISINRPLALSGDSPHYLIVVNSLLEDGDLDLSNNYQQAQQGDWDLGHRFRAVEIDHHSERDRLGREWSTHSPFFPLILSFLTWPVRNTPWVESLCIWATCLVAVFGIYLSGRNLMLSRRWILVLVVATPVWCYARDIWSEAWILAIWMGLLRVRHPVGGAFLSFIGTLIKYPFALVPMTLGAWELWRGDSRRGWILLSSGLLGLVVAIITAQIMFWDVDHFSLFHTNMSSHRSGIHQEFSWPFLGILGLLLSPQNGFLWFFPFLAWGLYEFRRGGALYLPALAYFLVHASYHDWAGGTGFSARYMVPTLPILIHALSRVKPDGRLFRFSLILGGFWGIVGGILPGLVYDRTPWGVVVEVWDKIRL